VAAILSDISDGSDKNFIYILSASDVNSATTKNTLNKLLTLSDPRGGVLAVTDPRDRLPPGEFSLGVIPGGMFPGGYICAPKGICLQS